MPRMIPTTLAAAIWLACVPVQAAPIAEPKLVLVTLDGVRWQDLFRGPDPAIVGDPVQTSKRAEIDRRFVRQPTPAAALTPFLHSIAAQGGVLIGDRDHGSCMAVRNPYWFSYPGYSEMLTGRVDPGMNTNDPVPNPHLTVLGWLAGRTGFRDKVAMVGTWATFHAIVARTDGPLPVNAGVEPYPSADADMRIANALQAEVDQPWGMDERFDAFTNLFALHALTHDHPRMLFLADGETDSQAHAGKYDEYLLALNRSDRFLARMWTALQSDPYYAGQTTMIVTTDHGRGVAATGGHDRWTNHGSGLDEQGRPHPGSRAAGSDQTWFAAIGPEIGRATIPGGCASNAQIAATIAVLLHEEPAVFSTDAAAPLLTLPIDSVSSKTRTFLHSVRGR